MKAIDAINKNGVLLVFPINNRKEPKSLWSALHPRSEMRWDWDVTGDDRVVRLWSLREQLSRSNEVIYSKWYSNRATFFSKTVFAALYRLSREWQPKNWTKDSTKILDILKMDSPLSTKQIKEASDLQGKFFESTYNKAMKPLWQHMDIVAFGEFQDSSFPSLGIGSTKNLFESLVREAKEMSIAEATAILNQYLPEGSLFRKFWNKIATT